MLSCGYGRSYGVHWNQMDRPNRPTKAVMAAQISIGMQGIETWSGQRQWHRQSRRARLASTDGATGAFVLSGRKREGLRSSTAE